MFTDEQIELRSAVRRFLERRSPETEVRRLMETPEGYDPAVWEQMANELGLQGMAIPEAYEGSGFSVAETAIVLEEMGRALYCGPFFSTVVLAANLLSASGDEAAMAEYLPKIASGELISTVALAESAHSGWDVAEPTVRAKQDGGTWTLSGTKEYVTDAHVAGVIFVVASTDEGVSVFAVDKGASGLEVTEHLSMDETRKLGRVALSATPARLVGSAGSGSQAVSSMLVLASIGLANEAVGGAQKVLELAVEHAKTRNQFGRPIGSFQAIKHRCSDMLVEVELAKSFAYHAAAAAGGYADEPDLPLVASAAKLFCTRAFYYAAAENIQIHGGMGFTWEHPAHLYFKRAKGSQLLFDSETHHARVVAERMKL